MKDSESENKILNSFRDNTFLTVYLFKFLLIKKIIITKNKINV